jgi:hypothetical protein
MIDLSKKEDVANLKDLTPEQESALLRTLGAAFLYSVGSADYYVSNWYVRSNSPAATIKYDPTRQNFVVTMRKL